MLSDFEYHRMRERRERVAAQEANDLVARRIHLDLAELHSVRAAELETSVSDQFEVRRSG